MTRMLKISPDLELPLEFLKDIGAIEDWIVEHVDKVAAGLVDYPSAGTVRLTPEGWEVTPRPGTPGTLAELHAAVIARLEPRHTRILQPVLDAFPDALSVEDLAAASGYSPTNSSFEKARGKLRSLGLFEYPQPGAVRATDVLFPEVLRG